MAPVQEGSFQLGFDLRPLTEDGELDRSLDNRGIMHSLESDMLFKLASENRDKGNAAVKEGNCQPAIGNYSEAIMQLRSLENEQDVRWNDEARLKVRELRATLYLNLSLCFFKLQQWTHCINTATRALQGDKEKPDPRDAVLPPEKRAKALFRRANAQCEGFGNFDKALEDLKKALEYTPDDKAVAQMLKKCEIAVKKTEKAATKKMSGFLKKEATSGEGLFDDSLRPSAESIAPKPAMPSEPVKMSDGLWVMPKMEEPERRPLQGEEGLNLEELSREIAEMREENPEEFQKMRDQVKDMLEQKAKEAEAAGAAGEEAAPAAAADAAEAEPAAA
eukprot:TRINITY_DN71783_c0_g1_i1.p1 TRINITY_DN71783_c0_g1~~TRINITY_DN71783_c0_g1_i1.p1  ORF type:complete len:334 (-),score=127.22 TRINITY_DN71783_c0_g1_i1:152-1153(-)